VEFRLATSSGGFHSVDILPESCTKYRSEAQKALCLKRSWSDFDPQAYYPYGEDQNHETSFKGKALQALVDSWCKIQVLNWGVPDVCLKAMPFRFHHRSLQIPLFSILKRTL
jgi:hypothetical protein